MPFIQKETVAITTSTGGAATAFTPKNIRGEILAIIYTKDTFANGVDFTITTDITGQGLWTEDNVNASAIKYPRAVSHDSTGGVLADWKDVPAADERVKIVIASGGDTKAGTFDVLYK